METIALLTKIFRILAVVMVIIAAFVFAYIYMRSKKRRKISHKYEDVDYSNLQRLNSKDYIKIDDIKDDIIITDNGTRFIGVLDCTGFDFYSAHASEQGATVQNYLSFINTIDGPITYRQYCKSSDLEDTMDRYKEAYQKVCDKLLQALMQFDKLSITLERTTNKSERELYVNSLAALNKEISALEFRKFHLEDQMRYIDCYSGNRVAPLSSETYVFDWSSDSFDLSDQLSEDELFEKAKRELHSIANSKIHALEAAGVKAKRCTTDDLIDMCRRHSQPISTERFKKRDVNNCNFDADIVSSDSVKRVQEYVLKVMQEENSAIIENAFENSNFEELLGQTIENIPLDSPTDGPSSVLTFD